MESGGDLGNSTPSEVVRTSKDEKNREESSHEDCYGMHHSNTTELNAPSEDNKVVSVADMVRETVTNVLRERYFQGFEYFEELKMYYNAENGLYYDPDSGLFFEPSTRCYYYFDEISESYSYYSRQHTEHTWTNKKAMRRAISTLSESYVNGMSQDEVDVFECLYDLIDKVCEDDPHAEESDDEIQKMIEDERIEHPPCIRVISPEDSKLFVVTIAGAKLGTADCCDIVLPRKEAETSETIAEIEYDMEEKKYYIHVVHDTLNLFVNGIRLNAIERRIVEHSDVWQYGSYQLIAHIHHGANTCGLCEPGLSADNNVASTKNIVTQLPTEVQRRMILKEMKKEFGIYSEDEYRTKNKGATARRGNPSLPSKFGTIYDKCAAKPVAGASLDSVTLHTPSVTIPSALDANNRGFRLLQRMGWKEGSGLGREETGIVQPIIAEGHKERKGLGSEHEPVKSAKDHVLEVTRDRFIKAKVLTEDDLNG